MEVALVLVVGVEPRVGVCPDQVTARRCRPQQRDVVDVHAGRLGRIKDVRHVHEDGDVLAHWYSLGLSGRPAGAASLHGGIGLCGAARDGSRRGHGSLNAGFGCAEAKGFPARRLRGIVRARRFDDSAPLVAGRSNDLLEEGCGDAVDVVFPVDNQEVHRTDETAGTDGRPKGEDRTPDHDALRLRNEDARLRQVHQLAEKIRCSEGAGVRRTAKATVAQGDEPVDVRDTGRSDQIFHAFGSTSTGRATEQGTERKLTDRGHDCQHPRTLARRWCQARPNGVAFGSPTHMIRHRFGGHLRAVRRRFRRPSSSTPAQRSWRDAARTRGA